MKRALLQVLTVIFSSILLALSLPNDFLNFGLPLLAVVAAVPLYMCFYGAKSRLSFAWMMALHVISVHLASSSWLANFHGYGVFSLWGSAIGTSFIGFCSGLVFYEAFSPYIASSKKHLYFVNDSFIVFKRVLIFSSFWIFWEFFKSTGALGYPWGTFSMACYSWKFLAQISDITGVWGISFTAALCNAVIAEIVIYIKERKHLTLRSKTAGNIKSLVKFLLAVLVTCNLYGAFEYFIPREAEKHVNTVIVQQNVDPWDSTDSECIAISKQLTLEGLDAFREQNLKCDLVLWSEGVLGSKFPSARYTYKKFPDDESLSEFIKAQRVPFLIGGEARVNTQKKHNANSAVLFDTEGEYSGFSSKIHLVPFAEKIPYSETKIMRWIMKDIIKYGSAGWTPGYQYVLFKIPVSEFLGDDTPLEYGQPLFTTITLDEDGLRDSDETRSFIKNDLPNPLASVKFTSPICFEDSFSDVLTPLFMSGSEVFMNITNDSWSKTPAAEYQHFVAASYAAIEYRTTMVRCCNSGYSAVILPNGKIMASLPVFTESSMSVSVPVYKRQITIFAVFGNWFAYLALAFLFAMILKELVKFSFPEGIKLCRKRIINVDKEPFEKTAAPAEKAAAPVLEKAVPAAPAPAPKTKKVPEKSKTAAPKTKKADPESAVKTKAPVKPKAAAKSTVKAKAAPENKAPKSVPKTKKTTQKTVSTKKSATTKKTAATSIKKPSASSTKKPAAKKGSKK